MSRHELDLMSLLSGLFFTLLGIGFILNSTAAVQLDAEWVLPLALIAVGVVGLVGSFVAARSDTKKDAVDEPGTGLEPQPAEDG